MKFTGDITANDIATEWAERKQPHKGHDRQQAQLSRRVRGIFVFLFVMAILVFAYNRHVQIQSMAVASLQKAADQVTTDKKLRQGAINYEKQIDTIAK